MEGFYVVLDFTGHSKKTLYSKESDAVKQAHYLAEKDPGRYFYVAQAQRCFVSPKGVQEINMEYPDEI